MSIEDDNDFYHANTCDDEGQCRNLIAVISDLHLDDIPEFEREARIEMLNQIEADYLVLAGDVCSNVIAGELFKSITPKVKKIILVRGNHEYYNNYLGYKTVYPEHIHLLESDNHLDVDGIRFIGDTLWTDIPFYMKRNIESVMGDFHCIYKSVNQERYINIDDINELYRTQLDNIKLMLQMDNGGRKNVVVTHHSPSFEGVVMKYLGNPINCGFHSNALEEVEGLPIAKWVHGHCHDDIEYVSATGISVLCSPYGYYREKQVSQVRYFYV